MSHCSNAFSIGSVTMKTSFDKNAYVPGETAQARIKLIRVNYLVLFSRLENKSAVNAQIPSHITPFNRWFATSTTKAPVR